MQNDDLSTNKITYRLIPGHGWYVCGFTQARKMGLQYYALMGPTCARGHVAPMSVHKTKCIKCLAIEARNKQPEMTNEQSFEFWRRKLKLPKVDPKGRRFVYVAENMPYTKLSEAAEMTGLTPAVIYARCKMESFPSFQQIPTKYKRTQSYVYYCGRNEYNSVGEAAIGEKMKPHIVIARFSDSDWPKWFKSKIM